MSTSYDELLSNIKRQAKRLSKSLNIPLRQAQSIIAMSVYQCKEWNELRESLKSNVFNNQLLFLAGLQPNSDTFLYHLLNENLDMISLKMVSYMPSTTQEIDIEKKIVNIFGIEHADFITRIETKNNHER